MKWIKTESKFMYNCKPVVRVKMISDTVLGEVKVFQAVSGKTFYCFPTFTNTDGGEKLIVFPKVFCSSIEEGVCICNTKWEELKIKIFE